MRESMQVETLKAAIFGLSPPAFEVVDLLLGRRYVDVRRMA